MTYLIAQIWLFIAAAAVVGLFFGAILRGGFSAARHRDLKRRLSHAEDEAADQRREAAQMAARAERRDGAGKSDPAAAQAKVEARDLRERLARAQSELRTARSEAERHADEAGELRAQLSARPSDPDDAEAELEDLRGRIEELEADLDEARAAAVETDDEEVEALRERVAELEAAARTAEQNRPASVGDGALRRNLDAARSENETLRARNVQLQAELEAALEARDADDAGFDEGALRLELETLRTENEDLRAQADEIDDRAGDFQAALARIGELEAALAVAGEAAAPDSEDAPLLLSTPAPDGAVGAGLDLSDVSEEIVVESERLKWRNGYLTSRIHFLENKLREVTRGIRQMPEPSEAEELLIAARDEIERLRDRVAELEEAASGDQSGEPAPNVDGGHGSIEWRNRYLASRVRYLEQQLADAPQAEEREDRGQANLREKLVEAERAAADATQLRKRVSELERAARATQADGEGAAKSESEYALEWRNRYLSSRVKYLEDRLVKAGLVPQPPEA